MTIYRPKKLIDGFRVNIRLAGKQLVAIPQKKLVNNCCLVIYKDQKMFVSESTKPLETIKFGDKFGRGTYDLYYFEFIADENDLRLI